MSKNWTPREQHFFDEQLYMEQHHHMYEQMITFKTSDGKEYKLFGNETLWKRFPNFAFYCYNTLNQVKDEKVLEVFDELEKGLSEILKKDNFKDKVFTVEGDDIPQFVVDWYNGKLDPDFYYSEKNHQMLLEKVESIAYPERNIKEHNFYDEMEHDER